MINYWRLLVLLITFLIIFFSIPVILAKGIMIGGYIPRWQVKCEDYQVYESDDYEIKFKCGNQEIEVIRHP